MKVVVRFIIALPVIASFAITTASFASIVPGTQNYRIQQITANAAAASSNAGIYQWKRVNTEVAEIDTNEYALEIAGVAGDAYQAANLRQAVLNLRTARSIRSVDKIQEAASQVIAAANALMAQ